MARNLFQEWDFNLVLNRSQVLIRTLNLALNIFLNKVLNRALKGVLNVVQNLVLHLGLNLFNLLLRFLFFDFFLDFFLNLDLLFFRFVPDRLTLSNLFVFILPDGRPRVEE